MVLGIYFLTYGPDAEALAKEDEALKSAKSPNGNRPHIYRSAQEAELAYENGIVKLHDKAEYRRPGHEHFLTTVGRIIFNDRVERAIAAALGDDWDPEKYEFVNQALKKREINEIVFNLVESYGAPAIAQALDAFKELGFHFSTQAGISISKNNVVSPPNKEEILDGYEKQVTEIEAQYDDGLLSEEDRKEQLRVLWDRATDEVAQAMEDNLDELNPIFMMANSGARGSFKQIRQLAGMRGLMANPKGEIIERPIKSNFMEGLSVLEYFISTHGARKGLADTALRTADSGYLTRRLVDVSQDVIIRGDDCKTKDFVETPLRDDEGNLNQNLVGRISAKKFTTKRGRELLKRGQEIDLPELEQIAEAFGDEEVSVPVRSVLKCELESGVCQACYGRALATGSMVELGDAVGIIAAQSIGEPGTQLTMRTFHTGGVAGARHHPGSAPRGRAVRGAQAQGHGGDGGDRRQGRDRGDRQGDPGHDHRLEGRGAPVQAPAPDPTAGQARRQGRGRCAARGGVAVPRRPAADPRPHGDRALPRAGGPEGLQGPGRRHQRQAHRADRPPDAEAGADRRQGLDHAAARARSRIVTSLKYLNKKVKDDGGTPAKGEEVILGITKASLATESFLSAASFQETTKVLTDAALEGKRDKLVGLKENVIIGKLIPAATGLRHYRTLEIEPVEPAQRPDEDLLDEDELAAELGLAEDGEEVTELEGFGPSFAEELEELAQEIETGADADGSSDSLATRGSSN